MSDAPSDAPQHSPKPARQKLARESETAGHALEHATTHHPERGGRIENPRDLFHHVAAKCAIAMGAPWAFVVAALTVVAWAATGPVFHYSETWQLVINTGTTIVTFLMIFLVQNTQNRDSRAIHLKLDELLRGVKGARTALVDLEDATDEELDSLQQEFKRLREARKV